MRSLETMERDRTSDQEIELMTLEPPNTSSGKHIDGVINLNFDHVSKAESFTQRDENPTGKTFWAWATVVSAFLIQFNTVGYATAFGVFEDFYVREFLTTSTSSQISWIGSTQSSLILTTGLLSGPLFDKGYCYLMVISGAVLVVLSLFLLSLAQPEQFYQVFLSQALGVGIGGGLLYAPSLAVVAQHFSAPHARTRVLCISAAGTSIGGLVYPILLNQLFHQRDGDGTEAMRKAFARGVRASAGLTAGLLLIAVMLMRTKYAESNLVGVSEEDREKASHERRPIKLRTMIEKFARDWPYVCFVIGMTLYEMVFFFPSFYLQLDAIKHGLDSTFAFYALSILNGAAFFGRLVPGFFTHLLGVANMFVFATAVATVLIFCMLAVNNVVSVAVFAALYGFFSGALMTLMGPMLALLAESPAELGARMGMCFAITGFGSLTGTPIAGALLTSRYIWWRPIIFSGVICIFGLLLFISSRIILGRRKGSFWVV